MAAAHDEDFAADPVPVDKRMGWPLVFSAELGIATALYFLQLTSIITLSYGSRVALIAVGYASIVACVVGYGMTRLAIQTGFGTNVFARRVLGYRGAVFYSLISAANSFVYFAAEATIMGASIKQLLPTLPLWIVLPVTALIMIPLVYFGMRLLAKLQLATMALYVVLLAAALFISARHPSLVPWLAYRPDGVPGFGIGLLNAFALMNSIVFISGLFTTDYTRFTERSQLRLGSIVLGVAFQLFCFLFSGLLGIWFATRYLTTNPGAYFVMMLSGWGTVFAIATQLRINLANMYGGSMALVNILRQVADVDVSRHVMVLVFGMAVSGALFFDFTSHLTAALTAIGMFSSCFTCLVLADFYVLRPVSLLDETGVAVSQAATENWRWNAVASLLVATVVASLLRAGLCGPFWAATAGFLAAVLVVVLYLGAGLMISVVAARWRGSTSDGAQPVTPSRRFL